jgi:uncharacterized protein YceH (UPF0502 family)
MANDREQKIRDVYEAMHRAYRERLGAVDGVVSDMLHRCSRAAVDVLDPVTRIELSSGFHAEPGATLGHLHDVYSPPGETQTRYHVGQLSKAAVEAWAAAAEPRVTTTKTEVALKEAYAEIEKLEGRVAALGEIIEALDPAKLHRLDSAPYHAR